MINKNVSDPNNSSTRPLKNSQRHRSQKNIKLTLFLVVGVILMFGFSYLLVPIFTFVCKQAGINGKGASSATIVSPNMKVDYSRTIKVEFTTVIHGGLNFNFFPLQRHLEIHPGESKLIYFYAENLTGDNKTVQAVPSITPPDAARFLRKTECFCFTQQYFSKGKKADMAVKFFVDPSVSKDIKEITLSYTLFDATGFERKQTHFTKGRIDL